MTIIRITAYAIVLAGTGVALWIAPYSPAAIRLLAASVKAAAADEVTELRQAARYEVYRLTGEWWRMVRSGG